jgi:hypothetical protein
VLSSNTSQKQRHNPAENVKESSNSVVTLKEYRFRIYYISCCLGISTSTNCFSKHPQIAAVMVRWANIPLEKQSSNLDDKLKIECTDLQNVFLVILLTLKFPNDIKYMLSVLLWTLHSPLRRSIL